jgi:hypothetical protein
MTADAFGVYLEHVEDIGRRMLDTVKLNPLQGEDDFGPGLLTTGLIRQAQELAYPAKEPSKAVAMKAAQNAASKAEKALKAINEFNSLWEYDDHFQVRRCPWRIERDGWSPELELQKIVRYFRETVPAEFDELKPRPEDAAERVAEKFPEEWARDFPEGCDFASFFFCDTIELFIGISLAREFENLFGQKPTHTKDRFDNVGGPFVRFAGFIMSEAGVNIAASSIARYLASAKKTVELRYGESMTRKN